MGGASMTVAGIATSPLSELEHRVQLRRAVIASTHRQSLSKGSRALATGTRPILQRFGHAILPMPARHNLPYAVQHRLLRCKYDRKGNGLRGKDKPGAASAPRLSPIIRANLGIGHSPWQPHFAAACRDWRCADIQDNLGERAGKPGIPVRKFGTGGTRERTRLGASDEWLSRGHRLSER